jgi:cobalt-zinc-cadmium efflux system membrane fusion protein
MPDSVSSSNGVAVAQPPPARPGPAPKPSVSLRPLVLRWAGRVGGVIVTLAILTGGALAFRAQQEKKNLPPLSTDSGNPSPRPGVSVLSAESLSVTPDVMQSLGIRTAEVVPADRPRQLPPLKGILNVDLNRQIQVHSAFAGIVVALGTVDGGETEQPAGDAGSRVLKQWDKVKAGQLLAVVWSKDLGEKKSELVQAVSDLKAARDQLKRYESLTEGIIAGKDLIAARFAVQKAENDVTKAESTLRAWRLPEPEIKSLITEAEKLGTAEARREFTSGKTWARVEVRAPFAGTILEKNVNIGSVVDTTATVYLVADLSRLTVSAQVFGEDLPTLQAVGLPIPWEVRIPARPDFRASGSLEQIGEIIDSTMHTALINGTVENPRGELKVGEFVRVLISIPAQKGEYVVPTQAVVEDGRSSVVFVQPDTSKPTFVRRPVTVVRRFHDVCHVKADPESVQVGDKVVTGGALQLNQALTDAPQSAVAHR